MSDKDTFLRSDDAIAERLCAAILGQDEGFTDALYGVETVEEPKLRELVEMARGESAKLIKWVSAKLDARTCVVAQQTRKDSSLLLELRSNDDRLFEVVVDDIYEVDGRLLTRDLLKFRPLDDEPAQEA